MICKNCNAEVTQNYCANCGHRAKHKRIDAHYILGEISGLLNFEKGLPYTIKQLISHPGETVKQYLYERNNKLVKPINFIIVTAVIFYISDYFFHFQADIINVVDSQKSSAGVIAKWILENYAYSNLISGIFIAAWIKIFFKNYQYNLFEILILVCYIIGFGMLIFSVFGIAGNYVPFKINRLGDAIGYAYCT